MRFIFILSLILTMKCVVGSETAITLHAESRESAQKKVFLFKLKVNENMVLLDNSNPAVFQIECKLSASNVEIFLVIKRCLISSLKLNGAKFETMTFLLLNRPLQVLSSKLHKPEKGVSCTCIPTCALMTNEYPKKAVERGKYINFSAYFLDLMEDGSYTLHTRINPSKTGE
jgi:hypothetical protein